MYDLYAQSLLDLLPSLEGLDKKACRRFLTKAYHLVLQSHYQPETRYDNDTGDQSHSQGDNNDDDPELFDTAIEDYFNAEGLEVGIFLRRLTDTLESIAVFDKLNGLQVQDDVRVACAFVAAESLALHSQLHQSIASAENDPFLRDSNYTAIESALLYMIGGYDINTLSIVASISTEFELVGNPIEDMRLTAARDLVERILCLCTGDVSALYSEELNAAEEIKVTSYEDLVNEIRCKFYVEMRDTITTYLRYLVGDKDVELNEIFVTLETIRSTATLGTYTEFADIGHMSSLLVAAIEATKDRATFHVVPRPELDDQDFSQHFENYLKFRTRGDSTAKGRPFLWPTAIEYVRKCLPGPQSDCVISMPTGSGKSYVAELATVHALGRGWVLYLAPTNALAHQIRRDLSLALKPFPNVQVRAFVGGAEYSTVEEVDVAENFYVAVMTPEKCSLALRLKPEEFATCSLCVFDECHLLNDNHRGLTVDVLLAQLMGVATDIRFLLMSAMVSNPQDLAEWLSQAHDGHAIAEPIKWRPSRTLRGLLVVSGNELNTSFQIAKASAAQLPGHRKNVYFQTPMAVIFGLSGPWTLDGPDDYLTTKLPVNVQVKASRNVRHPEIESWKNPSSRIVSEMFAASGMPVINFILSSRHHAFSSASKVSCVIENSCGSRESLPEVVQAWLSIADAELGTETVLWDLLVRGITVHTSAMLQVEQAASEWMFANQRAKLMFATGTLAQGLNLPSVAVVIAGTSMGNSTEEVDLIDGITRANAMILNAFGRAGRPGFSNQGVAILVSDDPYVAEVGDSVFPQGALQSYGVLAESDASVEVHSPVERFIDTIMLGNVRPDLATPQELELASLLTELTTTAHSEEILSRTFGAFKQRELLSAEGLSLARSRILQIKTDFFESTDTPPWMNTVAMKAGADFFSCVKLWEAYTRRGLVKPDDACEYTVLDWLNVFFEVMACLPPRRIERYLPEDTIRTQTVLTRMRDNIADCRYEDRSMWVLPDGWIDMWYELRDLLRVYMNGQSFSHIATTYLPLNEENVSNGRSSGSSPIPAVFKLIRTVFEPLAVEAGWFVALNQFGIYESEGDVPYPLSVLPLCIRNGCNSIGTISWYRFGFRQRTCAHSLEQRFPLPEELSDEVQRANWVRTTRSRWLEYGESMGTVLDHARTVILNGMYS